MGIGQGNSPVDTMWNMTADGSNSYWSSDGLGGFNNRFNQGYIDSDGSYGMLFFELPSIEVKRGRFSGWGRSMQFHSYSNSPYYQHVRDKWKSDRWDAFQSDLEWVGAFPILGEPVDLINGGIYAIRGKYAAASLSVAATVPVLGWLATAVKIQKHHIYS